MIRDRRFPASVPVSIEELAKKIDGRVVGDGRVLIKGFATLRGAGQGDIAFYDNQKYFEQLACTQASAVLLAEKDAERTNLDRVVVDEEPRRHSLKLLDIFYPKRQETSSGVSSTAVIDPAALISPSASIASFVHVGQGSRIGGNSVVHEGCVIGPDVTIGDNVVIYPNVTIYDRVEIGDGSVIHSGAVIGADGFGFVRVQGRPYKIPQVGRVLIGIEVEIGAMTAIDRGALDDTVIGDRVKIDNHVQIGHNVFVGSDTVICGKVGISGSVVIGSGVTIGGNCGIKDHVTIANNVVVTGGSNVTGDIDRPGAKYAGVFPAMPGVAWQRCVIGFRKAIEGRSHDKT